MFNKNIRNIILRIEIIRLKNLYKYIIMQFNIKLAKLTLDKIQNFQLILNTINDNINFIYTHKKNKFNYTKKIKNILPSNR